MRKYGVLIWNLQRSTRLVENSWSKGDCLHEGMGNGKGSNKTWPSFNCIDLSWGKHSILFSKSKRQTVKLWLSGWGAAFWKNISAIGPLGESWSCDRHITNHFTPGLISTSAALVSLESPLHSSLSFLFRVVLEANIVKVKVRQCACQKWVRQCRPSNLQYCCSYNVVLHHVWPDICICSIEKGIIAVCLFLFWQGPGTHYCNTHPSTFQRSNWTAEQNPKPECKVPKHPIIAFQSLINPFNDYQFWIFRPKL